jgi:hypothetical protein
MEAPQKSKNRTAISPSNTTPRYHPAIPLLGIYSKESKSGYTKDTCTPMFTTALVTIAKP